MKLKGNHHSKNSIQRNHFDLDHPKASDCIYLHNNKEIFLMYFASLLFHPTYQILNTNHYKSNQDDLRL